MVVRGPTDGVVVVGCAAAAPPGGGGGGGNRGVRRLKMHYTSFSAP